MQFDPEQVHQRQGKCHRHGNGRCGNHGYAEGQHQNDHDNNRQDGQEELPDKMRDVLVYHRRLVSNNGYFDIRRNTFPEFRQFFIHMLAELHDVIAGKHLNADNQGVFFVNLDFTRGLGIRTGQRRHVFQPDNRAVGRSADNLIGQFFLRRIEAFGIQGNLHRSLINIPRRVNFILGLQDPDNILELQPILGQFQGITGHQDLFVDIARTLYFRYSRDGPEHVLQLFGILFQLVIGNTFSRNPQNHGLCISKVGIDDGADYTFRQVDLFGQQELVTQLAPENVRLFDVIIELYGYDNLAVFRGRNRLGFFYFFKPEQVFLQFPGDLFFDLSGAGTGVVGNDQALRDRDFWVLPARHI